MCVWRLEREIVTKKMKNLSSCVRSSFDHVIFFSNFYVSFWFELWNDKLLWFPIAYNIRVNMLRIWFSLLCFRFCDGDDSDFWEKMEQSKGGVWGSKFDGIRGGIVVISGELWKWNFGYSDDWKWMWAIWFWCVTIYWATIYGEFVREISPWARFFLLLW